jgi:hypothetical protein
MHDSRLSVRGKKQGLWSFFLNAEIQDGTQFIRSVPDDRLFIVLGSSGKIVSLPRSGRNSDGFFSYLHAVYGLGEREDWSKFLYDSLRPYVHEYGTKAELRRFSVYNSTTKTAYISAYNGHMWKIEGEDKIKEVTVGEDGVFFIDDDPGMHTNVDIAPHGILLDTLTNVNFAPSGLSGITPELQRKAMIIWLFALAFPDLMPTKPLLILEGAQGSGKSACAQLMQLALMGVKRPMIISRNKEDDFGVLLLKSPIAIFDNLDSYIEWIPDAVCAYATAGSWTKRVLYSDDESITLKPHAFIAVASKNPASFRREDTADRCVVIRLERREKFTSMKTLESRISTLRPKLLGEYLWYVSRIVSELRASTSTDNDEADETFRMADFASLGRVVARVMNWPETTISELMTALQGERDAFINEEDPLSDLLMRWISYKPRMGPSNVGRIVSVFQLHAELETLAQAAQIPWKHSPRTLAQKMRSPHIDREFYVEPGAHNGQKTYRIYRHTDARLSVIE